MSRLLFQPFPALLDLPSLQSLPLEFFAPKIQEYNERKTAATAAAASTLEVIMFQESSVTYNVITRANEKVPGYEI